MLKMNYDNNGLLKQLSQTLPLGQWNDSDITIMITMKFFERKFKCIQHVNKRDEFNNVTSLLHIVCKT
jgi:hypothetical protein